MKFFKRAIIHYYTAMFAISIILMAPKCSGEEENADKSFKVTVNQSNIRKAIDQNKVNLKREPFDLIFHFPNPMGLVISATFDSVTYHQALAGKHLDSLKGFGKYGMAEGYFNPDKEVLLDNKDPSYWYYENDAKHRFNKDGISKVDTGLVCVRSIANFNLVDSSKIISVKEVQNSLYGIRIL